MKNTTQAMSLCHIDAEEEMNVAVSSVHELFLNTLKAYWDNTDSNPTPVKEFTEKQYDELLQELNQVAEHMCAKKRMQRSKKSGVKLAIANNLQACV